MSGGVFLGTCSYVSGRGIGSGNGEGRAESSLVVPCKRGGTAEWGRPAPAMSKRYTIYYSSIPLSPSYSHISSEKKSLPTENIILRYTSQSIVGMKNEDGRI